MTTMDDNDMTVDESAGRRQSTMFGDRNVKVNNDALNNLDVRKLKSGLYLDGCKV